MFSTLKQYWNIQKNVNALARCKQALRARLHDTAPTPVPSTAPYGIQRRRGAMGIEPIDKWCHRRCRLHWQHWRWCRQRVRLQCNPFSRLRRRPRQRRRVVWTMPNYQNFHFNVKSHYGRTCPDKISSRTVCHSRRDLDILDLDPLLHYILDRSTWVITIRLF